MELKDTVTLMLSDYHRDRFTAEYLQLTIRIYKLKDIIVKYKLGKLEFKLECPIDILIEQFKAMVEYHDALLKRKSYMIDGETRRWLK